MEFTSTNRTIYNLQTYNGQSVNSSNIVFDSGGQLNKTLSNTYNSQISGLKLFTMVAPFTVIFALAVTGMYLKHYIDLIVFAKKIFKCSQISLFTIRFN